jgi:hypothetical protein
VERSMQVATAISKEIPVEIKNVNPWGLFVVDWTGDID